jgi:hypothetical protein
MTATTADPPVVPAAQPPPAGPVRIRLKPPSRHQGMVNGAWWPRSRDLAAELPSLIEAVDRAWGRIYHVTVQVHMWPDIPKRVQTGAHVVRVGWYDQEQDKHDICLISLRGGTRRDLLVVPPELDPETAERAMATAATPGNMQTTDALLAAAIAEAGPENRAR